MRQERISLKSIELNKGQIDGLPANPRTWTREQLDKLKKSIEETPELLEARGLIVMPHGKKYIALGGNMRLCALKELGHTDAPCFVMDEDTTTDKMKEIVIKDNGAFGSHDYDALANEWDDLPLADWGVPAWDADVKADEPEAQEDDFDENTDAIEEVCKPGDIWQLGEHRLMCGNSTMSEDVERLMDGEKADLLLTDPPYNVNYEGSNGLKLQNDDLEEDRFANLLTGAYRTANSVMRDGAAFYVFYADLNAWASHQAAKNVDWKIRQVLIWNKNSLVLGRADYQWKHEPCLYGWKEGAAHYFVDSRRETTVIGDGAELDIKKMRKEELVKLLETILTGKRATTVIECANPSKNAEHPTMKPVKLIGYLMRNSSKSSDIVLDTFGGSGTTLIAAEQLGRKCRMMELDPHYCDVIIARWEKLTGKQAIKLT